MKIRLAAASVLVIALVLLAGCPVPNGSKAGGSLSVAITNSINSRTLTPSVDMNAASYSISGSGPNGSSFSQSTAGGTVTFNGLAFGSWTITVNALNAAGTLIGSGMASAVVHTGQITSVAITVIPMAGNGTLNLSVNWNASQVETPSILASLTPSTGSPLDVGFTVEGNQATFSSSSIPAGYHTLSIQLLDNGIPVMGAVEVARIVAGQTTTGTYTFENVNAPGGSVQVNITPVLADPILVSISGVNATMNAGGSMTATASATDGTANVVWVWYLNGVSVGTGASYTVGSTVSAGYYRLDVTGFSADGTRAGSDTASFQVTGTSAPWTVTGFTPMDFDVSRDGAITVVGNNGGAIRAMCFNPDGSVRKPAFTIETYDTATYDRFFGMKVARAGTTGQSAVTWNYGYIASPNFDWQTRVAFLDSQGNVIAPPRLLDPAATVGINRVADVRMSNDGVSAFIYEAQSAGVYRLIICNADGTHRAARDIGRGFLTNGALGRAIGMRRTTGDIIVAGESWENSQTGATSLYYQRFTSAGLPVDADLVKATDFDIAVPWSIYFQLDYNDNGNVAFVADVDYSGSYARKVVFYSPSMAPLAVIPPFGNNVLNDRVLSCSSGDFITTIVNGAIQRQRYTQSGQLVSSANNGGLMRLDGSDNLYMLSGTEIQKNPFPL